ncbi:MAG: hypothetical protein V2B18_12620 [Pseudomonadota bacterium]
MDFEAVVMHYPAAEGLFLSPQFSVKASGKEWSCPDLVALDFSKPQVQVVEVTTAADISGLLGKIAARENQWFNHLRPQLQNRGVIDDSWNFTMRAFVREDCLDKVLRKFHDAEDVRVEAIEHVAFPWRWPWSKFPKD